MTPADIISEVRKLVNDSRAPMRYTDAELLGFVNQTLRRMVMYRPDLFIAVQDIPTVSGSSVQTIPADGVRLVEIYNVKGGNVLTEVNKDSLDQTLPGWRSSPSGQPVNYMRHVRNPNMFFLYPPPESGVVLVAEYVSTPVLYGLNDPIAAPVAAYMPLIIDGVVFLTQSVDDEHINSGRAKLFSDMFTQGMQSDMQMQQLTDMDAGSLDPKRVV
jgi:hypothetical protein